MQLAARGLRRAPVSIRRLGFRFARTTRLRNEPPAGVRWVHGGRQLMRKPLASGSDDFALGRRSDLVSDIGARSAKSFGRYATHLDSRLRLPSVGPAGAAVRSGEEALRSSALQAGFLASRGPAARVHAGIALAGVRSLRFGSSIERRLQAGRRRRSWPVVRGRRARSSFAPKLPARPFSQSPG